MIWSDLCCRQKNLVAEDGWKCVNTWKKERTVGEQLEYSMWEAFCRAEPALWPRFGHEDLKDRWRTFEKILPSWKQRLKRSEPFPRAKCLWPWLCVDVKPVILQAWVIQSKNDSRREQRGRFPKKSPNLWWHCCALNENWKYILLKRKQISGSETSIYTFTSFSCLSSSDRLLIKVPSMRGVFIISFIKKSTLFWLFVVADEALGELAGSKEDMRWGGAMLK